jgi:hypothetical protein
VIWNWIVANKEWLFSGILVTLPLAIAGWFFHKRNNKQVQKSGNNSTNVQIGGNFTIKSKGSDE